MADCSFCRFFSEKTFLSWEGKFFWIMFDFNPVSPGHLIIIPKRHIVELKKLTTTEWSDLQKTIKFAIKLIEKTDLRDKYRKMINFQVSKNSIWFLKKALNHPRINTKPDAYNHGINDGQAAGRTVDHFHWHVVPRYTGDVKDPRGGVRYIFPDLGNYKTSKG